MQVLVSPCKTPSPTSSSGWRRRGRPSSVPWAGRWHSGLRRHLRQPVGRQPRAPPRRVKLPPRLGLVDRPRHAGQAAAARARGGGRRGRPDDRPGVPHRRADRFVPSSSRSCCPRSNCARACAAAWMPPRLCPCPRIAPPWRRSSAPRARHARENRRKVYENLAQRAGLTSSRARAGSCTASTTADLHARRALRAPPCGLGLLEAGLESWGKRACHRRADGTGHPARAHLEGRDAIERLRLARQLG